MRRSLALLLALLAAAPLGAVERALPALPVPTAALGAAPGLPQLPRLPQLSQLPRLAPPAATLALAPGPAPVAAAAQPETSVVRVQDVARALADLRAASYPRHEDSDRLLAALAAAHPGLPLDPDRVFLVKDEAALAAYGIPSVAAGAARIVSDGRAEAKIVILVAPRGVSLDDFVEYAVHEAVHLRDDGILRISHERFVEHWLAEGYTQLRSHAMANDSLRALGRPERPNAAYSREVALVRAFIARHGEAPLRELVETGRDDGLRRALGENWQKLLELGAADPRGTQRQRDWFLRLAAFMLEHPDFGDPDWDQAARALHGRPS